MSHYESLLSYMDTLPVVDAHEHLISEKTRLNSYQSFFELLCGYAIRDLMSAGLLKDMVGRSGNTGQFNWGISAPKNEEEAMGFFRKAEPYWKYIKNLTFARPARLSMLKHYGSDEFTEENMLRITREMNLRNQPGHYDEMLAQCNIVYVINQGENPKDYSDKFRHMIQLWQGETERLKAFFKETPDGTFDDYIDWMEKMTIREIAAGAVGYKANPLPFMKHLDKKAALEEFEEFRKGKVTHSSLNLDNLVLQKIFKLAAKYDLVVAIHTGVWPSTESHSPKWMEGMVDKFGDTKFDIYHMGAPYMGECAMLGKNYSNVHLNFCWTYCISEDMARSALNYVLDLVPMNKIFAFGADVNFTELIWGQLQNAKETLAGVFSEKIEKGRMDREYAEMVLKHWFYDNPVRVYKL